VWDQCTTVLTLQAQTAEQNRAEVFKEFAENNPKFNPGIRYTDPVYFPGPDEDYGKIRVLIVGDGNFGYSKALAANNPNWQIIGTSYGNGSNMPILEGFHGDNLIMYRNVDSRRLQYNPVIMGEQFDAVVFNNPRPTEGNYYPAAISLVDNTLSSAWNVLKPGGEMKFSGTGGMPTIWHIKNLMNMSSPFGYSGSYGGSKPPNDLDYYADPFYGVLYQPVHNSGAPANNINLSESHWYNFVR
jgi:hypothetical protein